jgi:hypothetical protein
MKGRIYIPTDVDERIQRVLKRRMADEFGGYTILEATGGWKPDGREETEEENVRVFEADGMTETFARPTAEWVSDHPETDQDVVMWEVLDTKTGFE